MPSRAQRRRATLPVLLATVMASCGGGAAPRPDHPVVLIGVDGLEPAIVAELLAEGRLPNLATFVDEGVVARLASMIPSYSPVVWTTIATGQSPEAHGVTFFHDDENRPFSSNSRRVPALWNLASDAGLTVNCVGWWITWPAEPINGRMLSSYAAQAQASLIWKPGVWESLEEQTWPPGLIEEIRPEMVFLEDGADARATLYDVIGTPTALDDVTTKSVTDLGWTLTADLTATNVTRKLLEDHPSDLTLAYLATPDVAGHRFWSFRHPEQFAFEVPAEKVRDFAGTIDAVYVEVDRLLGEILSAAPADANVIVVSDHGMQAFEDALDDPEAGTTGHHERDSPGVFVARGPAFAHAGNLLEAGARGLVGSVFDVAPLVLRLLGQPVPGHWPALERGAPLASVLEPGWARANPSLEGPDPDPSFRPATPPRVPATDMNRAFLDKLRALGYAVGGDPEDPEASGE